MVESGLKEWLNREEVPGDFYQLVGRPRLCRDLEQLLDSLEKASEYLFQFQNHKDKNVRDRARTFHRQVAEARRTISDESRWDQYDRDLIARLYRLFRKNPDFSGPNPKLDNLRRWLAFVQNVDPARIEELIADWTTEKPNKEPAAKPPREVETQTYAAQAQTEVMAKVEKGERESKPTRSRGDSATYREADDPLSDPEMPAGKTSAPPPPPGRSASRDREMKAAPPPPPKTAATPSAVVPAILPAAGQQGSSGFDRHSQSPGNDATALWIMMAAFLTAVVLGMFALIIAWASGAFDRRRSEVHPPAPPAYVDNIHTSEPRQFHQFGSRIHFVANHNPMSQRGNSISPRVRTGLQSNPPMNTAADHRG